MYSYKKGMKVNKRIRLINKEIEIRKKLAKEDGIGWEFNELDENWDGTSSLRGYHDKYYYGVVERD